ncbi:hypothetical protein BJX70DRAFT_374841 [Aspergillus crustosus]
MPSSIREFGQPPTSGCLYNLSSLYICQPRCLVVSMFCLLLATRMDIIPSRLPGFSLQSRYANPSLLRPLPSTRVKDMKQLR